jgi:3-isopropylmalate/(R)-2-methylmalate dehydratase small subunit
MGMTITETILADHAGRTDARIFDRTSINLGLPLFETPDASRIEQDDVLEPNPSTGAIKNLTRNESYRATPLPPFAQEIMAAAGPMRYVAKKKGRAGRPS